MSDQRVTETSPRAVVALVQGVLAGTEDLYISDFSSGDLEAALESRLVQVSDPEVAATIREELAARQM